MKLIRQRIEYIPAKAMTAMMRSEVRILSVYVVVGGSGRMKLDDEVVEVKR